MPGRAAFFIVGIPGLLIALLVRFTIEPPRGSRTRSTAREDHIAPACVLWRVRTTRPCDRRDPTALRYGTIVTLAFLSAATDPDAGWYAGRCWAVGGLGA